MYTFFPYPTRFRSGLFHLAILLRRLARFFLRIPAASLHEVGHEPGTGVVGEVVDHVLRVSRAGREQQRSRSGRKRGKHKQKTNHLMIATSSTNGGRHASVASRSPGKRKTRGLRQGSPCPTL